MKKLFLFLCIVAASFINSTSQVVTNEKDTSNFPYWIEMMSNPEVNFYETQRAFELYWEGREIEKGSGFKPFKRWEYSTSELIDARGNIPRPGLLEKRVEDYIQNNYPGFGGGSNPLTPAGGSGPANCLTNGNWVELGPQVLSGNRTSQPNGLGRINALAFHPKDAKKIYIGAPAGGLWWTQDGGSTWTSNTDTLATLGISAIAIDYQSPDTIYLGTGDRDGGDSYGRGVFRSLDGGQTWKVSNTGMGNRIVGRLIIDPTNSAVLLAGTNGGIYRSTNYGVNWSRVQTGNMKELVFDAVNPNYVYAANYSSTKFYRSTDNGQNWTQITSGLPSGKSRMAIAVTPDDSNYVYAIVTNSRTFEGLYLSTDRGLNFTQMSNTPNIMDYSATGSGTSGQAWYDLDIAADPTDRDIIYVGGVNIFKSTDKGKTWKINAHWVGSGGAPAIHADQHVLEYQPNTDHLYVGNDGGIYFTTNGGSSWTDISKGIGIAQIYRLGQSATNRDLVINGYQDNGTGQFENGSWYTVMGGDGMDCVINPKDPKYSYSDLYYGDVRRYTNGSYSGKIAANGRNGINESGAWVTPFILQEGTPSTMFIGYKNVWRSTNIENASSGSVTWTKISDNLAGVNNKNITYLENSSADPKRLYMSRSDAKFFKTTNVNAASPTWTDLTSSLPNNATVGWIETHSTFKNRLWILQSNKVYRSDNGGSSWTNWSTGLPNIPLLSLVFDTSSAKQGMYLGTYMGVFYRDTTMTDWIWFNENMPINTRVRDIEVYYDKSGRDKSHVICATYGRGNWRSPLYDEEQLSPTADFSVDQTKLCANEVVSFGDLSLRNPTRWTWKISPSSVTYINGTDSCSQYPKVRFNAKGTYSVKLVVENCSGIDSIERVDLIEVYDAVQKPVCTGHTTNIGNYGIGIIQIDLNGFSKTTSSTYTEGGYLDMACTEIIRLKSDTAYFAVITTGKSYDENVKIYIDYNNNGDMSDAGELVFSSPKQRTTHGDTIRIPAKPALDQIIRMRVMSDYDTIPDDPCDTLKYGQMEDYGVIIESRLPTALFSFEKDSVCLGELAEILDSSTGDILNYKWRYSNSTWSDSSNSTANHQVYFPSTGFYKVELILNDGEASMSLDSAVYVIDQPRIGLSMGKGSNPICEGLNVGLNAIDSAGVLSTFTWQQNGISLANTASNLTLVSSQLSDSGTYQVIGNYFGCLDTTSVLDLKIKPLPIADFDADKYAACRTANNINFTDKSQIAFGQINYSWHFGGNGTSTVQNPSHQFSDTGLFSVKLVATSDFSCLDSVVKDIRIAESPLSQFSIDRDSQCFKGHNFNLSNNSSISSGTLTSLWDFGDGNSSSTKSPSHSYVSPGTYDIQLISTSTNSCSDTTTKTVVVHAPINGQLDWTDLGLSNCTKHNIQNFNSSSTISNGSIISREIRTGDGNSFLSDRVLNYSYTGPGSYTVELLEESDRGCNDTTTITVGIHPDPIASFSVNDTIQCHYENKFIWNNLSSISSGTIDRYDWNFGDATSSTSTLPLETTYASSALYVVQLIAESDQNCKDTIALTVEVAPTPEPDFDEIEACEGEEIAFSNNSKIESGTIVSYSWDFDDGNSSSSQSPNHTYQNSGSYEVSLEATSDKGCIGQISLFDGAIINEKPTANFSMEKVRSWQNETDIQFSNLSSSDVSIWTWLIENSGSFSESDPLITFTDTGLFRVLLIVENDFGCVDSISDAILIFPEGDFFVPTSFSPNGDGTNDMFGVTGVTYAQNFTLAIYNRWGQQLFLSNDITQGWDGKYQGEYVSNGSYLFKIEFQGLNRQKYFSQGSVLLLR